MKRKRELPKNTFTWISLKLTHENISEVACIITDENLNYMSPCFKAFVNSELNNSPFTLKDIETSLLQFIKDRVAVGTSILAGINVDFTLCFLNKMPSIIKFLSHKTINISSIRELCWRWNPTLYKKYKRVYQKRALLEVKEAIKEFLWYRNNFFVCKKRRMLTLTMPKRPGF